MRSYLARRWFLLLVTIGLTMSLVWPDFMRPLVAWVPTQAVVAGALFLTAWSLESRRLLRACTRPGPVLLALAVSYGFLPLSAWLSGWLVSSPDIGVGLLVMAAVPCTMATAVLWTRMAGGNEATALLIVLLSTVIGPLAAPAWLSLIGSADAGLSTGKMMFDLAVVLLIPVGLAQGSRAIPAVALAATHWRTTTSVIGRLLILTIMLKTAVEVARYLPGLTPGLLLSAAVTSFAVHTAALFLGYFGGKALRFERGDSIAIAFAGSQKTLPVALYLYQSYYVDKYPLAVLPLALIHVGQLLVDTLAADRLAPAPVENEIRVCQEPEDSTDGVGTGSGEG